MGFHSYKNIQNYVIALISFLIGVFKENGKLKVFASKTVNCPLN